MIESKPHRPLPITLGAVFIAIVATLWTVFFLVATIGGGAASLDGREVSQREFFVRAGGMLLGLGLLGVALAIGLWRHRTWARPLTVFVCVLAPIVVASPDEESRRMLGQAIRVGLLGAVLSGLYLYGAPRAREYYAELAARGARDLRPNGR